MTEPKHLQIARSLIGALRDGPDVPRLAMEIAHEFPDMTRYCQLATDSTAWCGIFIANCLMRAYDLRPPFNPKNELLSFMWVDSWEDSKFGNSVPISQAQPGDILVLKAPHHITFIVANEGDRFRCIGGNQGDSVTEATYAKSGVRSVRRPLVSQAITEDSNFNKCLKLLLVSEGGNDDDPRDPGGRTSRGILQREWNVWRESHPGLPSDVWDAPDSQVAAIYLEEYWDVLRCDELPGGVDYVVFDFGVNSGVSRSAKFLQAIVGAAVDGEIGPETVGLTNAADSRTIINELCDDRMAFLRGLSTWPTFGRGWTARVDRVRADSLKMVTELPEEEEMTDMERLVEAMERMSAQIAALTKLMTSTSPIIAPVIHPPPPPPPAIRSISVISFGFMVPPVVSRCFL